MLPVTSAAGRHRSISSLHAYCALKLFYSAARRGRRNMSAAADLSRSFAHFFAKRFLGWFTKTVGSATSPVLNFKDVRPDNPSVIGMKN